MPLRDLYRMAVFAKIVEKGSFSEAADALGLGKSAVSQHLTALEAALDVKLITRTTRALTLTLEGQDFYESCALIVAEVERAERRLDAARDSERGRVKLTCSYNLGVNFVVPALAELRNRYPHIEIDLILDDRVLNMVDGAIDVSLRSGWLTDCALYAVTLAPMKMIICASPEWIAVHGMPQAPADLSNIAWVGITGVLHTDRLALESDDGRRETIPLLTPIRVNSGLAAFSLITSGIGVGMLPDYAVHTALHDGVLVHLLPEWRSKMGTISALFPSRHHMSHRTRLLVDFLKSRLAPRLSAGHSLIGA